MGSGPQRDGRRTPCAAAASRGRLPESPIHTHPGGHKHGHPRLHHPRPRRRGHRQGAAQGRGAGGILGTFVTGILGAVVGGLIASAIGIGSLSSFFSLGTWLIAIGGALLLLVAYNALATRSSAPRARGV
jgi:uncharacterized membrane protein YeaQ/YmgE (transglycosylase-associated protein family)